MGSEVGERLKSWKKSRGGTKYTRYTNNQIEVLDRIYATSSNPNSLQREQMKREESLLKNIDDKHLKIWFQNRRSRKRQKKGSDEIVAEMTKLVTMYKQAVEKNDSLDKRLTHVQSECERLRSEVFILSSGINKTVDDALQDNYRLPSGTIDNNTGIFSIAEEIKCDFLTKATGDAIDWIPIPVSKLSRCSSIRSMYISNACMGVAARACAILPYEPAKTIELLKDRFTWSRMCRNLEVHTKYDMTNNKGTIELIYTRNYSPTVMACARDFWTLRYFSILDDGSFVVCEKSISGSNEIPVSSPVALEFVRGKMMASGYLVRAYEGGSIVHVVDHIDFEASTVPMLIRPLYQSSTIVATKMTISAIQYVERVATEANHVTKSYIPSPIVLRSFGRRISRYYSDAINGFTEDGWILLKSDDCDTGCIITVKPNVTGQDSTNDYVICIKTTSQLYNISPATIVRFLKERRSEWMAFDFVDHYEALPRKTRFVYPQQNTHNLTSSATLLGETGYSDEVVEVIKFDYLNNNLLCHSPEDLFHLQISNGLHDSDYGLHETDTGACSEFIFAPFDKTLPSDCVLLSSGFRIFSICSDKVDGQVANSSSKHEAVSHEEQITLITMAFQFPFESHRQVNMEAMAREYIRHIIFTITNSFLEAMSPRSTHAVNPIAIDPRHENNLATMIFQSYRSSLGVNMLGINFEKSDSLYDQMEHHQYAIIYFSLIAPCGCIYANQMALNMFETTTESLQFFTLNKIMDGSNMSLQSLSPSFMQQGYAILPPGYSMSVMNRRIAHKQGVAWLLHEPDDSAQNIVLAFFGWSFV